MIAFIYPDNEPAPCTSWVLDELRQFGMGIGLKSHPSNFDDVYALCGSAQMAVFFGGTTQLSWLFDTAEKRSRWLGLGKPRVMLCGEMVFIEPHPHPCFKARFAESTQCATHLIAFQMGPDCESEAVGITATGLPVLVEAGLPIAASKYPPSHAVRKRRFCFAGTDHGIQRQSILKALVEADLVDVLPIPKTLPFHLVEAYQYYAGVINLRSNHDRIVPILPRLCEAALCGCAVLDLQGVPPASADVAINLVRNFDWDSCELVAHEQLEIVKPLFTQPFFQRLVKFVRHHALQS